MSTYRKVTKIHKSIPTIEGAGVRLKRAFGNNDAPLLDPFLLLDDFHSDNPSDYLAGFPWHPHRGIETVTYVIHGQVEHGDSIGNSGVIGSGDVQWMTAGSGIIHSEMPKNGSGIWGLQLWVNLPSGSKMMDPRYRDIKGKDIPEAVLKNGVRAKVICGSAGGVTGPAKNIIADPEYLDITMPPGSAFEHKTARDYTVFSYTLEGSGHFESGEGKEVDRENLVIFSDGDSVLIKAGMKGLRFLLVSGKPIGEPVAWYGPIVMNTQEELETAFEEYNNGTFLKHRRKPG